MSWTHRAPLRLACCAAALLVGINLPGHAADYPERPIRLIVPNPPGGPSDLMVRSLAAPLEKILGQPLIIDNQAGAAGTIGATTVARAAPDGYTLFLGNNGPISISPLLQKLPYDPATAFEPVTLLANTPMLLYSSASVPAQDIASFIRYAETVPKGINIGVVGGTTYLMTELFLRASKVNAVKVSYKGGGPVTTALLADELQAMITIPSALLNGYVKSGKLRALGVSTPNPSDLAPGVPPISRAVPGVVGEVWFGVLAPAGTPAAITGKLQAAFARAIAQIPASSFQEAGLTPVASDGKTLGNLMAAETRQWAQLIREANIKFD